MRIVLNQFARSLGAVLILTLFAQQVPAIVADSSGIEFIHYDQLDHVNVPLNMTVGSSREILVSVKLKPSSLPKRPYERVGVNFMIESMNSYTFSLDPNNNLFVSAKQFKSNDNTIIVRLKIHANYIGRGYLEPLYIEFSGPAGSDGNRIWASGSRAYKLRVHSYYDEGIWGTVFVVSVIVLMIIIYINLGAQLDEDNVRSLINNPFKVVSGFLLSTLAMPFVVWNLKSILVTNEFFTGAYVFACCPVASASSLWTVMLRADKELAVGLQVVSNFASLITMPALLYTIDKLVLSKNRSEDSSFDVHLSKIPYARLMQASLVLLISLIIGWRFVARNERAKKFSQRYFRAMIFSVLLFIIVFSTILYWRLLSLVPLLSMITSIVLVATSLLSFPLALIIGGCNLSNAVAITIACVYKNSGIAFGVLLVMFGSPDCYEIYMPCLAQVIVTSLSLYLIYASVTLVNCCHSTVRRYITRDHDAVAKPDTRRRNSSRDASSAGPVDGQEENDEFIAMNVTDIEPSDAMRRESHDQSARAQTEVKVVMPSRMVSDI